MELSQLLDHLSAEAKRLGISQWDLAGSKALSCSVSINSGKIDKTQSQDSVGYGLRVMDRNSFGYIYSSDLSFHGLTKSLEMAQELSHLKLGDTLPKATPLSLDPLNVEPSCPVFEATPPDIMSKTLLEMEQKVLGASPHFKQVSYNGLGESRGERFYLNSLGSRRHSEFSHAWTYLYLLAEKKQGSPRKAMVHDSAHSLAELDLEGCVKKLIEKGHFVLDFVPAPKGSIRVCFHPEAFLTLIQCFSNIWNARRILDGKSLTKKENLGERIASNSLTLTDHSFHPSNLQPQWFDDEGVATRPLPLIEQGLLTHLIHNEETARHFDHTPTGHAVMGPRSGVSNHYLIVENGKTHEDWKQQPDAIYVEKLNALHAGIQDLQGSFSLPIDGQVSIAGENKSFDSAVISGDILSSLKKITHVDSLGEKTDRGFGPEIWIDGITVTAG